MNNVPECIEAAMQIEGAVAVALVEWTTGNLLGSAGPLVDGPGIAQLVISKVKVMGATGKIDPIEDMIVTLGGYYHVIRPVRSYRTHCLHLVLDRASANLALARMALATIEETLVFADEPPAAEPDREQSAEGTG